MVRTGLQGTLNSFQFSLTALASNDDVFAKVPADLANIIFTNDAFIPHLTDLLLYHVLAAKLPSNQRGLQGKFLLALNGESLAVTRFPTKINGNTVVARNMAPRTVLSTSSTVS